MTAQADSASSPSDNDRSTDEQERRQLRQQLRQQRRAIPAYQRTLYARQVAIHLQRAGILIPGKRVGVYLALPEEISLAPVIELAWSVRCSLYVPHITHRRLRRMSFLPFAPSAKLRAHHWDIPSLINTTHLKATDTHSLDAILVPLVGFDAAGHRLGMGAGFYDRHFAWRRRSSSLRRPVLIGVAFSLQRTSHLPQGHHDVPLDAIVTEKGFQRIGSPR